MSRRARRHNKKTSKTEEILLVTALIQLINSLIDIIKKLFE